MPDREGVERRRYPRVKAKIAVEMRSATNAAPSRAVTEEISLCGCYVETMFTLDVGAKLDLTLWLSDEQIHVAVVIATRFPQVGNGFEFVEMAAEHRSKLKAFILKCERDGAPH